MAINDSNIASDNFWLNMAAEAAYSGAQKRSKSVENLKATITWAFGLFSVTGFATTLFGGVKDYDFEALLCFGITFAFLTVAYIIASNAEFPVLQKFNSNAPAEVRVAFSETVEKQTRFFKWAAATTAVAFFFLVTGILIQAGSLEKEVANTALPTNSSAYIKVGMETSDTARVIPITIMAGKSQPIKLSLINAGKVRSVLHEETLYTDSVGRLYYSYKIPSDSVKDVVIKASIVEMLRQDSSVEHSYFVSIKAP